MSKVEEIVEIVDRESPGLLDDISHEDGLTKEGLVRKVLALSHGQVVRTHHNPEDAPSTNPPRMRKGMDNEVKLHL